MATAISLRKQRQKAAEKALAEYDLGSGLMVTDTGNWISYPIERNRLSCRLYAEDNQAKPVPLSFHVGFANGHADVIDTVAYDLSTGNTIGTSGQ